ncbi:MAG TPA: cyclic nucleotide-binding domain-containing protein [Candidatus Eisenbacteria bacterium]|nr:cyclic nucleotide-binding domain-containing protein [Candidatus Eisenbacteria bacterium]
MVKASQQQDLSVLTSSKNGLVHLSANDWALIADKAVRRQFKAGEHLVQQSRRTHGVFLILKGTATVQIPGQGRTTDLGPGEVCGEISFIDELPATADVVAQSDTEAYYIDRPTLQSLFELFPHLGSRFYRSLASILSRRLREMIASQTGESAPAAKEAASSKKTTAK